MELDERKTIILGAVIKEYINTGYPVGSKDVALRYNLGVSSATIRNEMATLEKMGYLEQPHTSSGRVPSDKGYKFFVSELMRRFELSEKERRNLRSEVMHLKQAHEELGHSISKLLANVTNHAAFTLLPETVGTAGFANLVDANTKEYDFREVANFLEDIHENSQTILNDYCKDGSEVYIGNEIKLADTSNYTLIVTKISLPSGEKGLVGIVGPKRMMYEKNLSVLEYLAKLLGSGVAIILLFNF